MLVDYLLDGQQWMLRGVSFEATAQGRGISRTGSRNFGSGIAGVVNQTLTLTDYRSAELTAMRNRLTAAAASGTASPDGGSSATSTSGDRTTPRTSDRASRPR